MKKVILAIVASLFFVGCDNFPEELADEGSQGKAEYKNFKSELLLKDSLYEGLYEPRDGAITAYTVFRLWGVNELPELERVWKRLDNTSVLVLDEQGVRDACLVREEAKTPSGCLYDYDRDRAKAIVWAERMEDTPLESRLNLLCHEFLHAALFKERWSYDFGHKDPVVWRKSGGKESLEFKCAQESLVKKLSLEK